MKPWNSDCFHRSMGINYILVFWSRLLRMHHYFEINAIHTYGIIIVQYRTITHFPISNSAFEVALSVYNQLSYDANPASGNMYSSVAYPMDATITLYWVVNIGYNG